MTPPGCMLRRAEGHPAACQKGAAVQLQLSISHLWLSTCNGFRAAGLSMQLAYTPPQVHPAQRKAPAAPDVLQQTWQRLHWPPAPKHHGGLIRCIASGYWDTSAARQSRDAPLSGVSSLLMPSLSMTTTTLHVPAGVSREHKPYH